MSNKKVYLAKHVLASGFDVEYVKSSLLRIPGIDIVESGMGIEPKECSSFIIVAADGAMGDDGSDESVYISKNVAKDLKNYYKSIKDSGTVYIFAGLSSPMDDADVEANDIVCYIPYDEDINVEDKDNFNNYAYLSIEEADEFLFNISVDINASDYYAWKSNPRHPQPKAEYALPPLPTFEERRLKKSTADSVFDIYALNTQISVNRRRLLLLRRS